jgi:chromosome segregation ATPase
VTELETLDGAIALKTSELENLRQITVAADTLDNLNLQITEAKESYNNQLKQQDAEEEERQADRQLRAEEADHEFEITQRNKVADQQIADKIAACDKNIAARMEEMGKKEAAVKEMEAKIAAFPAEMDKQVKSAVAAATNAVTKEYTHKIEMLNVQYSADKSNLEARIKFLTEQQTAKDAQIEALKADVKAANERVENVTTKALDASSGREALEAVHRNNEANATTTTKR